MPFRLRPSLDMTAIIRYGLFSFNMGVGVRKGPREAVFMSSYKQEKTENHTH